MFWVWRSGNTISFLMEHEKYSYVEALRWLRQIRCKIEEGNRNPEYNQQQQVADSFSS